MTSEMVAVLVFLSSRRHTHLLQQILRAQPQNLDVAIPVANGKERRPDSVFRHLAHLEAGNLNPSQLFRAHFLKYTRGRGEGGRLNRSAKVLSTEVVTMALVPQLPPWWNSVNHSLQIRTRG